MNEEQRKLYSEWCRIEVDTTPLIYDRRSDGTYPEPKAILLEDIEKLGPTRVRVWEELRDFLSISEKFELGQRLQKSAKDIFETHRNNKV